jgi:hypothetical protein
VRAFIVVLLRVGCCWLVLVVVGLVVVLALVLLVVVVGLPALLVVLGLPVGPTRRAGGTGAGSRPAPPVPPARDGGVGDGPGSAR